MKSQSGAKGRGAGFFGAGGVVRREKPGKLQNAGLMQEKPGKLRDKAGPVFKHKKGISDWICLAWTMQGSNL